MQEKVNRNNIKQSITRKEKQRKREREIPELLEGNITAVKKNTGSFSQKDGILTCQALRCSI